MMHRRIIRVFPRRTSMTPTDADVRINTTPDLFDDADEVHISCLFSWDKDRAEELADAWDKAGFNVKLGGVAFGSPSDDFIIGRYVKQVQLSRLVGVLIIVGFVMYGVKRVH